MDDDKVEESLDYQWGKVWEEVHQISQVLIV